MLPVHGRRENALFERLAQQLLQRTNQGGAIDFEQLAIDWCAHVDGETIFPKLPVYLNQHHTAWCKSQRIKDAVKRIVASVSSLEEFLASGNHLVGRPTMTTPAPAPAPAPGPAPAPAPAPTHAPAPTTSPTDAPTPTPAPAHAPTPAPSGSSSFVPLPPPQEKHLPLPQPPSTFASLPAQVRIMWLGAASAPHHPTDRPTDTPTPTPIRCALWVEAALCRWTGRKRLLLRVSVAGTLTRVLELRAHANVAGA